MFLSFIVPVYNAESYIGECLTSLLEQDIPKTEYEVICVNDGSRDASPGILQQWQEENHNIVIIHQACRFSFALHLCLKALQSIDR